MKSFLNKYDTVIFDMDGVITSEQNYWNCAALVVSEFFSSKKYKEDINAAEMSRDVKRIRSEIFGKNDEFIALVKNRGVNSNWDLGYVRILIAEIVGSISIEKAVEYAEGLSDNILYLYESLAKGAQPSLGRPLDEVERNGSLWVELRDCFQEWFLGDKLFKEQYGRKPVQAGKPGLVNSEQPIIPMDALKRLLSELSRSKRVCIGTGRPGAEIISPLASWNVLDRFAENGRCTYDHVAAAEKKYGITLSKPHPYMFLKALYGTDYDDIKIINGDYDRSKIAGTLIVGDAGADILAAKAMGADFCAVLTGVNGKAARGYFEELEAEYILDSAADLL